MMRPGRIAAATLLVTAVAMGPSTLDGQTISGRLVDASNGAPVALAGVFVLDAGRDVLRGAASDTAGFYTVEVPEAGEYVLLIQRMGYFENETPLFRAEAGESYEVDFEMRPEPFRIDPLAVTVRNEELEQHLTLEFGINPNTILGYRAYQGTRVQQAKLKAHDNTDFLRELYVPVSHGETVCMGSTERAMPSRDARMAFGERRCGSLWLDGLKVPAEHIESIELDRIAVVVTFPGQVRLYTREFDWSFRPGSRGGPGR